MKMQESLTMAQLKEAKAAALWLERNALKLMTAERCLLKVWEIVWTVQKRGSDR